MEFPYLKWEMGFRNFICIPKYPTVMKITGPHGDTVAMISIPPVDRICRLSTRQHTVRSAHYTGLLDVGKWDLLYGCKTLPS
jgi:hypothetical protein